MYYYPRQENPQLYPVYQQKLSQMISLQSMIYHPDHYPIDRQQKYEHEIQYKMLRRPGDQHQYEHRSALQTTVDLQRQHTRCTFPTTTSSYLYT